MNCPAIEQGTSDDTSPLRYGRKCPKLGLLLRVETATCCQIEDAVAGPEDRSFIRVAQPGRRADQRIEHGLQIEGRAADHLQHIGGGGLLLQRLAQFGRPLLDLVLEVGIGFLQSFAHVVELIREPLQLVAGLDRDALGEIAAADPLGAAAQRLDRSDHAARQEHPGQHREDRCRE